MQNIQNEYYEQLKNKKENVMVILKNGFRVSGQILSIDRFTILLVVNGKQQLIYKTAISTITT
ncbi:RNA chaperone Hfq [Bacillus pseudomycoides]|uniref:RNA chaperone Hfq n=1 Tax=Bacillus pseudomycoides TaxID=64104 RepID=UPI0001A145F1|nr:RNA chaperone Hfq [Bacillus pseudomycoides]EEM01696.1 Host factor-I protein [Bacillus pseudomycoides]PEJ31289.1 RNA chaperone Hfq [Bacillus pseudomycoides]PEM69998.1 RNA chaperone Hfq [Bacillus pseudomycoides]PFX55030.1 RNA chaperone Hfq [Bacillus pseudomycoides]PFZ83129.1 RNA chaperone Hfq [Bacillus pseudomycoides]